MNGRMLDILLGIIVTISLALSGWALKSVVELRERVGINSSLGEHRGDRIKKFEQTIERLQSDLSEMKGLTQAMLRELNMIQNVLVKIETKQERTVRIENPKSN